MANALGTLATGVIAQTALGLVYTMFPILSQITSDFSDESCLLNQSVTTRKFGIPTVNNFGTAATDRADVDVPVTINQHKEVKVAFAVTEYSGTNRNLVQESAKPIAIAIGTHMVAAIAALWTNTNYGGGAAQETIITTANMNYGAYTNIRGVLNGRGVPAELPRFAVLNTAGFTTSLNDTTVVAWQNNRQAGDVATIATGVLTNVAGFTAMEYPALLTTGTSSGVKTGVFGTKDSTILAARVQRDPRTVLDGAPFPGNYAVVKEPNSGLSVLVTEWIDPATMTATVRYSWMYGVAVGNSNNLQITKSA